MKKRAFCFDCIAVLLIILLTSCLNPMKSDEASFLINLGGNNSRAAIPWPDDNPASISLLNFTVKFFENGNGALAATFSSKGSTYISGLIAPGTYHVELEITVLGSGDLYGTGEPLENPVTIKSGQNNIAIRAVPVEIIPPASWTVDIELNGGTGDSDYSTYFPVDVPHGDGIIMPSTLPTKTGNYFAGWFTDAAFSTPFINGQAIINTTIIYAKWVDTYAMADFTDLASGGWSFTMGKDNATTSDPAHTVTLSPFSIGKYEVTQAQYKLVMGNNPSYHTSNPAAGEVIENHPVDCVSWYDALVFCNKLSIKDGLTPVYTINGSTNPATWGNIPTSNNNTWNTAICDWYANGYRLPTEAEWEYACRAGTIGDHNISWDGSTPGDAPGWYRNNSEGNTHEVGKRTPNNWGLYDMHGNVREWCWDLMAQYDELSNPNNNPQGALTGSNRVYRGGHYNTYNYQLTSEYREYDYPYVSISPMYNGFRVVRTAP